MKAYFNTLIENKKLSHAYFLEGDDGSFAKWIAKRILCVNKQMDECDCGNCRRVKSNNHPDIFTIEPEGTAIKVDQIRELHQRAALKAVEGSEQIFIVKNADKMNVQASNALLKFLEEPKNQVVILLAGQSRDALLATISSRVQILKIPNHSTLERDARNKGYQFKALGIFEEIGCNMDDVEKYAAVADEWLDLLSTTMSSPHLQALMWLQKWDQVFAEKEQKRLSIRLLQSYVKALFKAKKGEIQLWGALPHYEWSELSKWANAVDELTRSFHSNGQYTLQLELFIQRVKNLGI